MQGDELKRWRKVERARLLAERDALDRARIQEWRRRIDQHVARAFPGLAQGVVAFCWPIRNEYDARHLARTLRERGALTALPVVVAPGAPLLFREWHPGVALASGPLGIPFPVNSKTVVPDAVLLPMVGWDTQGYRLGYGAGYFDRTLGALAKRTAVIGIAYEMSRVDTIHPQSWDIPADCVVTERGVYRRAAEGLAFEG